MQCGKCLTNYYVDVCSNEKLKLALIQLCCPDFSPGLFDWRFWIQRCGDSPTEDHHGDVLHHRGHAQDVHPPHRRPGEDLAPHPHSVVLRHQAHRGCQDPATHGGLRVHTNSVFHRHQQRPGRSGVRKEGTLPSRYNGYSERGIDTLEFQRSSRVEAYR